MSQAGKFIKAARKHSGLRQSDLAKKARISTQYLSDIEVGHRPLNATTATKIGLAMEKCSEIWSKDDTTELHRIGAHDAGWRC